MHKLRWSHEWKYIHAHQTFKRGKHRQGWIIVTSLCAASSTLLTETAPKRSGAGAESCPLASSRSISAKWPEVAERTGQTLKVLGCQRRSSFKPTSARFMELKDKLCTHIIPNLQNRGIHRFQGNCAFKWVACRCNFQVHARWDLTWHETLIHYLVLEPGFCPESPQMATVGFVFQLPWSHATSQHQRTTLLCSLFWLRYRINCAFKTRSRV